MELIYYRCTTLLIALFFGPGPPSFGNGSANVPLHGLAESCPQKRSFKVVTHSQPATNHVPPMSDSKPPRERSTTPPSQEDPTGTNTSLQSTCLSLGIGAVLPRNTLICKSPESPLDATYIQEARAKGDVSIRKHLPWILTNKECVRTDVDGPRAAFRAVLAEAGDGELWEDRVERTVVMGVLPPATSLYWLEEINSAFKGTVDGELLRIADPSVTTIC